MRAKYPPEYIVKHAGKLVENADSEAVKLAALQLIAERAYGKVTEKYPANPNGSPRGITGLTSRDGRVTIMMPHPERVFRAVQNSWRPEEWNEDGAWMRMFRNARVWVN